MNPKFQIFRGSNLQYYFRLKSRNGETILSSEGYNNRLSCQQGIASTKLNAPFDIRYKRNVSINNQYYFVLTAANGEALGRSEMYSTPAGRENGIEAVKRNAPNAPTEDLTA